MDYEGYGVKTDVTDTEFARYPDPIEKYQDASGDYEKEEPRSGKDRKSEETRQEEERIGYFLVRSLARGGAVVAGEGVKRIYMKRLPYFPGSKGSLSCFTRFRGHNELKSYVESLSEFSKGQFILSDCLNVSHLDPSSGKLETGYACVYLWRERPESVGRVLKTRKELNIEITFYDSFFPRYGFCSLNDSVIFINDGVERFVGAISQRRNKSNNWNLYIFDPLIVGVLERNSLLVSRRECAANSTLRLGNFGGHYQRMSSLDDVPLVIENLFSSYQRGLFSRIVKSFREQNMTPITPPEYDIAIDTGKLDLSTPERDPVRAVELFKRSGILDISSAADPNVQGLKSSGAYILRSSTINEYKDKGRGILLAEIEWTHSGIFLYQWDKFKEEGYTEARAYQPSKTSRVFVSQIYTPAREADIPQKKWWRAGGR